MRRCRDANHLDPLSLAILGRSAQRRVLGRELLRARRLRGSLSLRGRNSNNGAAREHDTVRMSTVEAVEAIRESRRSRKNGGTVGHSTVVRRAEGDLATRRIGGRHLPRVARAIAGIVGLNLGLDAATIGRRADAREARANGLDETVLHDRGRIVEGGLDDIVGE